tara:strand:+ start:5284 stop:8607 length:3324 start_codon:yes stop_codon:yes gene_type:complete
MKKKSDKTLDEKYQKKTQLDHIKELPDTYIGSVEQTDVCLWVHDGSAMVKKDISITPGFYKIFDEVLVNAIDHYVRSLSNKGKLKVSIIKVDVDEKTGLISVYNNGEGIDIAIHPSEKIYIPTMIFGELLTSTNYDKSEKKITGGKNGFGAKLTNIFSKKFTIETIDSTRKLKFVQTFSDNMNKKTDPKITKYSKDPYTKITFLPDFPKFGMKQLDKSIISLLRKRVYDTSAITDSKVTVFFNGTKIECKTFDKYVDLYIGGKKETPRIYEELNDRWEIVACVSPDDKFDQVSFVNGVYTYKGGKHVEYVARHICKKLQTYAATKGYKRKKMKLKQSVIHDNLMLFIRSTIENPSFDSQTKEYLTTISSKFGSSINVSDKFIEKLAKMGVLEKAMKLAEYKLDNQLVKTSGKKQNTIRGIPKLEDANWAGTNKAHECTLILTEGDSAKSTAVAGLSVIGRDKYGVFPLRGKLLNVRDAAMEKVKNNAELSNLVKIMGLQYGKKYTDTKSLRYGSILILTDQDVDGSHIKGLIMNWVEYFWTSLFKIDGFVTSLQTPIVKASKGKKVNSFYTLTAYDNWKKTISSFKGYSIKYYKGLGTSTSKEAKEYFKDLDKNKINYIFDNPECFTKVFCKDNSNDRKKWLMKYDRDTILDVTQTNITCSDFFDKDMIHFSNYDCERSIPSIVDGLKISQRKVLYGALKRNLIKEIKVAQLSGYVSETSCYHHGEQSLNETIISMAQNFVGSNNINLLDPIGQFGTRLQGGKDSASPRYIFTKLSKVTKILFNPLDNNLLNYKDDDGTQVEPYHYVPIIPMILVNGSTGIGTGFSTNVPSFNPKDLIKNILLLMEGKKMKTIKPWYRDFIGKIYCKDNKFYTKGICNIVGKKVVITELPIGTWTDKYKEFIEDLIIDSSKNIPEKKKKKQFISEYRTECTETDIHFTLEFGKDCKDVNKALNLIDSKNTSMSNIHLYNEQGTIKKYANVNEIIEEFYGIRLKYYGKRRDYLINKLKQEINIIDAKITFIESFVSGVLKILNIEVEIIIKQLADMNLPKVDKSYDYLIDMRIRNLTKKKILELKKQHEKILVELGLIESKTDKDLWKDDLKELKKLL